MFNFNGYKLSHHDPDYILHNTLLDEPDTQSIECLLAAIEPEKFSEQIMDEVYALIRNAQENAFAVGWRCAKHPEMLIFETCQKVKSSPGFYKINRDAVPESERIQAKAPKNGAIDG